MELRQYLQVIGKWWWLILLSTAIAGLVCWVAVKDLPDLYAASTTLIIGQAIDKSDPTYFDFDISGELGRTYSEYVKLEPILRAAAAALGFEEEWPRLRGQIEVELVTGTLLMRIQATDSDPLRAKLIADEIATQLTAAAGRAVSSSPYSGFIQEQAASFPPKIQAAEEEIQRLETELSAALAAGAGARQIEEVQDQILTLERQIYDWQSTFADYQLLQGRGSVNRLSVLEEANVPTFPIGPARTRQILLVAGVGMLLAAGAAFLLEYLDDTFKLPDDVTKATGLAVLGSIPDLAEMDLVEELVTFRYPKTPVSEAFRVMRTNLRFTSVDHPLKTLVVTSADPGEGKSMTAANLSVVLAQAGHSVILVDSDLRRPVLHRTFQLANREGLTTALLDGAVGLDGRLQETGIANLRLLTSGPLPPNPSEMLGSGRMRQLVGQLAAHSDLVIFDSPPALPVTDAAVLAGHADGVMLVTDARRTHRAAVQRAVDSLRQSGAHVLGVSLNRLRRHGPGSYYYTYYYYYAGDVPTRGRGRGRLRLPFVNQARHRGHSTT